MQSQDTETPYVGNTGPGKKTLIHRLNSREAMPVAILELARSGKQGVAGARFPRSSA
jgi:hypothetical protein